MKSLIICQRLKLGALLFGLLCTIFAAFTVLAAGETPEEALAWCESLAIEASEMAFKAQVACDYPTAHQAFNLADDAAFLVAKVSRLAQDTANPQLAFSTYKVSNQVEAAIANVVRAAKHIASHNTNSDNVHAANFLLDYCELAQKSNKVTMETALMAFSDISERPEAYSK